MRRRGLSRWVGWAGAWWAATKDERRRTKDVGHRGAARAAGLLAGRNKEELCPWQATVDTVTF
jgi:hypothetical protein